VALAECCMMDREHQRGATVDLSHWPDVAPRALLYGEGHGRVIVSTPDPALVERIAREHGVAVTRIGVVDGPGVPLRITIHGMTLVAPLAALDTAYHESIPGIMSGAAVEAAGVA